MFQSNSSYYKDFLSVNNIRSPPLARCSPPWTINTSNVVKNMLGPITFKYVSVCSNFLVETPDTHQPTVVTNNGFSWEVKVPTYHQLMI